MPQQFNKPEKKMSGIQKLPEATRKKILISSVTVITILILLGWAKSFSSSVSSMMQTKPSGEFDAMLEKTKTGFGQISQEIDKIKTATKILETASTTTSTPEISQQNIDKLKEKILGHQQATSTATSSNQ